VVHWRKCQRYRSSSSQQPFTKFINHFLTFTHSKPPPLFALIIGINEYTSDEFDDLEGAVADAEAVKAYLETSLGVPTSHIKILLDNQATRDAIIAALRDLKNNTSIQRGNPILIYYAGHGSTVEAPTGWEAGGADIQILVTHDTLCDADGNVIVGIPDRTIGVLLEQLAQEKDDNIVCTLPLLEDVMFTELCADRHI
jgi:Caspase domain